MVVIEFSPLTLIIGMMIPVATYFLVKGVNAHFNSTSKKTKERDNFGK